MITGLPGQTRFFGSIINVGVDTRKEWSTPNVFHIKKQRILNSFDCVYTNGFTEGCNNRIKVIKRVSFGIRNFDYFRNRILHCASLT